MMTNKATLKVTSNTAKLVFRTNAGWPQRVDITGEYFSKTYEGSGEGKTHVVELVGHGDYTVAFSHRRGGENRWRPSRVQQVSSRLAGSEDGADNDYQDSIVEIVAA